MEYELSYNQTKANETLKISFSTNKWKYSSTYKKNVYYYIVIY